MRRCHKAVLFTGAILMGAGASYGESITDFELKQWYREVARECPSKHLDQIDVQSFDGLTIGAILNLPPRVQDKIAKLADIDKRCADSAGVSCGDYANIYAAQRSGKLRDLVKFMCAHAPMPN